MISDIPDEAVEAAARASFLRQTDFDHLSDPGKDAERFQARRMLAAALPVLNTARPRLVSGDVPITERTPHGVWIADGPDPDRERSAPSCAGLSGCDDCRAYNALRQHLVEQILALDEQHQRETRQWIANEAGKREALMEMVAHRDTKIDELRRECDNLLTRLNEAHATVERLNSETAAASAAELNVFASSFAEGRDALIASGCPSEAAILGGCAKALRARAASLRGGQA